MPSASLPIGAAAVFTAWCLFLLTHHGYANIIDSISRRLHSHAVATRARHARRTTVLTQQWVTHFPLDVSGVTLYTSGLNESIQNQAEGANGAQSAGRNESCAKKGGIEYGDSQ